MGMSSALVPVAERALVCATAARLHHDLAPRPEHAGLDPGLTRRVCFVVAAIAPRLPPDRLGLLARYTLWTIRLDDRLDRPAAGANNDAGALDRLHRAVITVTTATPAADPAEPLADPLVASLAGIVSELSACDPGGLAVARFGAALRDATAAGVDHATLGRAVAAGTAAPPTAGRYLDLAARSVNYLSFGYALLAVARARPTGAVLDRVSSPLWHAAHAVRLANDLRSAARDRAAGTLNVLDLRTGDGRAVTPQLVAREIGRQRRAHDGALRCLPDRLADPHAAAAALALTRSLRLALDLYRHTDLR